MLASTGLFAFKANKQQTTPVSFFSNGTCVTTGMHTAQSNCNIAFTGPQCTVFGVNVPAYEAASATVTGCTYPLNQY